ncbi:MAG: hypothetical protein K1X49_12520 [Saprospiraceae bacterium]|nr:hypothetical protein [Saprospiraceae bacterium]
MRIPNFFGIEDLKVAIVQNITTDEDYGLPVRNTNLSFYNADSLLFTFDEEFLHDEKISVLQDPMQMADINGDGLLDIKLIFRHWGSGRLNLFTRVYYLFQTPDHTFDAFYVQYLMLNGSNDAEYDIDCDGNFEIVTMSYDLDCLIFRTFNYLDGKIVNVDEKFDYPLVSGIDFNGSEIQNIKPVQEVDVKELKPVEFIKMN